MMLLGAGPGGGSAAPAGVAEVTEFDLSGKPAAHFVQGEGVPGLYLMMRYVNDPAHYCYYFLVDGLESQPDATGVGATDYRTINVPSGSTDEDVAAVAATALFGVAVGAVVTVTQASPGAVQDAVDVNSGVPITVTVQGSA